MMGTALERQELVNGRDGGRIARADPHFSPARAIDLLVADCGAPSRHE